MLIDEIKEIGEKTDENGDKTLYHFKTGVIVNSPKFNGIFYDIVVETGRIVLFDGISPFARVIEEKDYEKTSIRE